MNSTESKQKQSLVMKLNLEDKDSVEKAYSNPTSKSLKQVPKMQQTEDLIKFVCSKDGLALRHASKKLITQEICNIAVKQNCLALQYVPRKFKSEFLCQSAIIANGRTLEYVPEDMRSAELVKSAVSYYLTNINRSYSETDEEYEQRKEKQIENAKQQGERLSEYERYPIYFVPNSLATNELVLQSIRYCPFSLRDVPSRRKTREVVELATTLNGLALKYVPLKYQTKEYIEKILSHEPLAIQYVMQEFISQEMCDSLFERDYRCFLYFPEEFITKDMCLTVINIGRFYMQNPSSYVLIEDYGTDGVQIITFDDFPDNMRNNKQILDAIISYYRYGALPIANWNEHIIEIRKSRKQRGIFSEILKNSRGSEIYPLTEETINYITPKIIYPVEEVENNEISPIERIDLAKKYMRKKRELIVPLEPVSPRELTIVPENGEVVLHELSEDNLPQTIYYISDIHIELQFYDRILNEIKKIRNGESQINIEDLWYDLLDRNISDMIEGKEGILLIGGDVANGVGLSRLFYKILSQKWSGRIFCVLGNHELWDFYTTNLYDYPRNVEEIVDDYREMIRACQGVTLLENQLYVLYKNQKTAIISAEDIIDASTEELGDIIHKSTLVILGGLGYSGLNPRYNANSGIYNSTITSLSEDKHRAEIFNSVYCKVKQSAYDSKVIVLTHTPVYDWNLEPYNPNWIYVNGHTHINSIIKNQSGVTVLSDNQVGYIPKAWKLNSFTVKRLWYDPFETMEDGIHRITSEQYKEFNRGRDILNNGCNYEGELYVLKRDGMYMFVLKSLMSYCLMVGGARKRLTRNIQYYYDNLSNYVQRVRDVIEPYKRLMQQIAKEVQMFGGCGIIHGCIVDISVFSHIYINPFDGKMTAYWAINTLSRIAYKDVESLLADQELELYENFKKILKRNMLPVIQKYQTESLDCSKLVTIPQWVFGTEMYSPSKIMRSVQYIWDQDVIRIWDDNVLNNDMLQIEASHCIDANNEN